MMILNEYCKVMQFRLNKNKIAKYLTTLANQAKKSIFGKLIIVVQHEIWNYTGR